MRLRGNDEVFAEFARTHFVTHKKVGTTLLFVHDAHQDFRRQASLDQSTRPSAVRLVHSVRAIFYNGSQCELRQSTRCKAVRRPVLNLIALTVIRQRFSSSIDIGFLTHINI